MQKDWYCRKSDSIVKQAVLTVEERDFDAFALIMMSSKM
jgi:hypothetical protein